ncbi:MAG: hypothetical protein RI885_1736 [Actinomycetota bacterium]|jgi:putative ABC transport system permease protein
MSFVDILRSAVANSVRSRLRTTLTVLAIMIGAFTLTITNGIGTGVNAYIDTQLSSIGAPDVMNVTKPTVATEETDGPAPYDPDGAAEISAATGPPGSTVLAMDDSDLDAIDGIDGIESIEPLVSVRPDFVEWDGNGMFQLTVSEFSAGVSLDLAAGTGFDQSTDELQIVLPTSYIETLGFADDEAAVGETVQIGITEATGAQQVVDATVTGVQNPTLFGVTASMNDALTSALYAVQQTGSPAAAEPEYASATARFSLDETEEGIQAIKDDLVDEGYAATTVSDQIGTFQAVVDGIILVLNAFAIIALIAAGFGIINTLLMSVQERTREIGLMKAMGMSGGRIFALFSSEAVFIGFLGSAVGAGLAVVVGLVVSSVLGTGLLAGLDGLQLITFAPIPLAGVFVIVMAIAFTAGTLPAFRAARQSPIESLRYE